MNDQKLQAEACIIYPRDLDSPPRSKPLQKVHIPIYGDHGLIVKPLAVSLCYSDAKILEFGVRNPRVRRGFDRHGWIIPGHEVLYEVVDSIGSTNYAPGEIIHVHPSAIFQNRRYLFGFTEPGGLCTRNFIGERFLNSEPGGNVLRLSGIRSNRNLALIEPWSCIEADFAESRNFENPPLLPPSIALDGGPQYSQPVELLLRLNSKSQKIRSSLTNKLPERSSLIVDPGDSDSSISLDLHDIHYRSLIVSSLHHYEKWLQAGGWKLSEHYQGHVVLFGGAGPMGQMYARRILMEDQLPEKITIIDRIQSRLNQTAKRLEAWSSSKSTTIEMICPPETVADEAEIFFVSERLSSRPDAIIVFCTDSKIIEGCIGIVNDDGLVNVFAGLPPGNFIHIPAKDLRRNIVLFGRSGSSIDESKLTVERIQNGILCLDDFVAKTVTLDNVWASLLEVKQRQVDGKVLVLPSEG